MAGNRTFELPAISINQLPASVANIMSTFNPTKFKNWFMRNEAKIMVKETRLQFVKGTDPRGYLWKSNAKKRKYNNRWSVNYYERPSGAILKPSSIRLKDTGELRDSFRRTKLSARHIVVEPVGKRNIDIAIKAIEKWGNIIVGWTPKRIRATNNRLEWYMLLVARKRI